MAGRRKLGRTRDPRRALMKGLATALIDHRRVTTSRAKAKELVPYVERLITKAKRGDLASRRRIIARVATVDSAHRLVDQLAGQLDGRTSGHLRLKPAGFRRGDQSSLATVSFVDLDPADQTAESTATTRATAKTKAADRKSAGPARPDYDQQSSQPKPVAGPAASRNRANQKRV